jgi:uncharacterized protein
LKSPCTKVCVMDPHSGLCRGCLRTLAEIACWSEMPESEKETLMAELAERRNRLDVPEIPVPPLA